MRGSVTVLVGAQWGSEGKGVIAKHIAKRFAAAVRVGGPNAGHSLFVGGVLYKMRSVPCIWFTGAELFIGAGAVINPTLLEEELAGLMRDTVVVVDPNAVVVKHDYEAAEMATIRESIGSTAEGVGVARAARMRRDGTAVLARDYQWDPSVKVLVEDVSQHIDRVLSEGGDVMLEGTQGSGLSLFHGTEYPFVTSSDTNASGMAGEAGIAPSDIGHVHLVARTYPIRVAGNSGPMGDELDWSYFVDKGLAPKPEQTTVTKKVRRISHWYPPVFDKAVRLNQPCGVWLTFTDYLDPAVNGMPFPLWSDKVKSFVDYLESTWGVPVLGLGVGIRENGLGLKDWVVVPTGSSCRHGDAW